MTVFFIIIFVITIAMLAFIIGFESSDLKNYKNNEAFMGRLLENDEEEKKSLKLKYDLLRNSSKDQIIYCLILLPIIGFVLALNIYDYRQEGMAGLKRGDYDYEEIVKTSKKSGEVVSDTSYVFYKIKNNE